jgi:ketosteroid isomerase-like protein
VATTERTARNIELLQRGYDAFGRGDMATLETVFHPEVVWHAQRLGSLGGDHRGWGELAQFFAKTMELTDGTFHLELHEILGNDSGAAAVVRSMGSRGGRRLDSRQIHHFHIDEGRIVEVWQFVDDGSEVDAFWS